MEDKIEINGWKQKSPKMWTGNDDHIIKVKKSTRGISIQCVTQFGYESDLKHTIEDAHESAKWFMNRRPQN